MEELAKKTETAEKKGDLLLFVKIQTALVAVLVLLLVVGGIFAAVQVNKAMRVVDGLDMDKINAAVQSLSNIAAELEKLDMEGVRIEGRLDKGEKVVVVEDLISTGGSVLETVEALRGAAQKLAEADIDAVNDGIEALTDAAGNLQNLDIEKLNDLIAALEKTAAQMEKTSAAFGKLFGK